MIDLFVFVIFFCTDVECSFINNKTPMSQLECSKMVDKFVKTPEPKGILSSASGCIPISIIKKGLTI